MNLDCESIYEYLPKIVKGSAIDISECKFIHPWALVFICLLLSERHNHSDKKLILPINKDALKYLKRAHFDKILEELSYSKEASQLKRNEINEKDNPNIEELRHYKFRDDFQSRLGKFIKVFLSFGMEENEARLVTALIGELGNNVFDHNALNWPIDITGCFISAQNYPKMRMVEFVIGDIGIGFLGSLRKKFPTLKNDIEAIKFGLEGNSGWFEGKRGNGLLNIKDWTFTNFSGSLCIHSGRGLVSLNRERLIVKEENQITGTIVQVMLYYK
jgi:hypothetical protein